MAKVLGESGRYVSDEAARQRKQIMLWVFVLVAICGGTEGFLLSLYFHPAGFPDLFKLVFIAGVGLPLTLLWKLGIRKLEALDKVQLSYQKGADGENIVGRILAKFPDEFSVINDLTTPFGNLDHVVVGPTGVFVLDTKN